MPLPPPGFQRRRSAGGAPPPPSGFQRRTAFTPRPFEEVLAEHTKAPTLAETIFGGTPENQPNEPGILPTLGDAITTTAKNVGQGIMRGGAKTADLVATLGAALTGAGLSDEQRFAADELQDETRRSALEHWTPAPGETTPAGEVLGGLGEIVLPLAATGGNPAALVGSETLGAGKEYVDRGVDATTAAKLAALRGGATAVGAELPFIGKTVASRVASGGLGNLALGAAERDETGDVLRAGGYDELAAEQPAPADLRSMSIDALLGMAFGGVAHARAAPIEAAQRAAAVEEILARSSAAFDARAGEGPGAPRLPRPALPEPHQEVTPEGQVGRPEEIDAMRSQVATRARDLGLSDDVVANLDRLEQRKKAAIAAKNARPLPALPNPATLEVDELGQAGRPGELQAAQQAEDASIIDQERALAEMGLTPDVLANLERLDERAQAERAAPPALPAPDRTLYVDQAGRAATPTQEDAYRRSGNERAAQAATEAEAMGFTPDVAYAALQAETGRGVVPSAERPAPAAPSGLGDAIAPRPATPAKGEARADMFATQTSRPAADHGMLSPNGRVSNRSRKAALARERERLLGDIQPEPKGEDQQRGEKVQQLRRAAENLRSLAERGMGKRKNVREAARLEAQADALERGGAAVAPRAPAPPPGFTRARRSSQPDESTDSVLEYLSKLGGVNMAEAEANGIDRADMRGAGQGIRRAFTKKGMSLDRAAELLDEAGFDVTDPATGRYDANRLLDILTNELRGQKAYSARNTTAADEAAAQREQADDAALTARATEDRRLGERAEPARRQNLERRKTVAAMTPEELRRELLTHELTGLPNRRAYEEAERLPHQVAIDVDSLKWVNDNMGHASGDELLKAIAAQLAKATDRAYHLSGDEFVLEAKSAEHADDLLAEIEERLGLASIEVTKADGSTITVEGLGISYGRGNTLKEADADLGRSKEAREASGQRARRGEQPPSATRSGGRDEGRPDHEGNAPDVVREPAVEPLERTPEHERILAKYNLPADWQFEAGDSLLTRGKYRVGNSNWHSTLEAAAKEAQQFRDLEQEGERARTDKAGAEKEAAAMLRRGEAPSFALWKRIFPSLREGHRYVHQSQISPFLMEHFGFSRNRIRKGLGAAAGTLRSDSGAEYPIVYLAKLPAALQQQQGTLIEDRKPDDLLTQPPTQGDLFTQADARPGSTKKQIKLANEALHAVEKLAAERRKSAGKGIRTLISTIAENFREDHGTSLIGQRLRTAADLGALAQVYRDPRFETLRYLFVDGEGKVVGETGVSARLPASASAFPFDVLSGVPVSGQRIAGYDWVRGMFKRAKARGLWMLHNHPSGVSSPSEADMRFTERVARELGVTVEHVVIDHNEYSHFVVAVDPDGGDVSGAQYVSHRAKLGSELTPDPTRVEGPHHPVIGVTIDDPGRAAAIGKSFERPGFITVVGASARHRVNSIGDLPVTALGDRKGLRAALKRYALQNGSNSLFLVVDENLPVDLLQSLVDAKRGGYLMDAVDKRGNSVLVAVGVRSLGYEFGTTPIESSRKVYERYADDAQKGPDRDLFGDDTRARQATADETRRRDAKRSPNRDVHADTGAPGDLFTRSRQIDFDDIKEPGPLPGDVRIEVDESADGEQFVLRVVDDDKVKGFELGRMSLEGSKKSRTLAVSIVHVDRHERGRGIGQNLIRRAAELAKSKGWRLVSDNIVSVQQLRVYESLKRQGWTIRYNDPAAVKAALAGDEAPASGVHHDTGTPVVRLIEPPAMGEAEREGVAAFAKYVKQQTGLGEFTLRALPNGDIRLETMAATRTSQGAGTQALELLTDYADRHGKRIVLGLAEKGHQPIEGGPKTTSRTRLRKFYQRFGFVQNKGRHKDFTLSIYDTMYRDPQRASVREPDGAEDITLTGEGFVSARRDVEDVELEGEQGAPDDSGDDQVRDEPLTGRRSLKAVLDELREQAATAARAGDSTEAMKLRRQAARLEKQHEPTDDGVNEPTANRRGPERRETNRGGRRYEDKARIPKGDKGYARVAQKAIDVWNDKVGWRYGPLGKLVQKRDYLAKRYLALGNVDKAQDVARAVGASLDAAHAADRQAVYEYLTNKDGDPKLIEDASIRAAAVRAKALIDQVGQRLVDAGLISQEAYDAHAGEYLPRLYLKHVLEDAGTTSSLGAGLRTSDQGYTKPRKDLDEETRKVILGEITDPAFLASFGLSKTLRDLAVLDFLESVSRNDQWVPKGATIEWRGKSVSTFWLEREAAALRRRSRAYDAETRARADKLADEMDDKVQTALAQLGYLDRSSYEQIPNSARYGALRGLWVRKEIYNDLVGANHFLPPNASVAESVLGDGGILARATSWWKFKSVLLNPPTQVRNFISNMPLLHLSGVPARRVYSGELIGKAIHSITSKDRFYQIAKRHGLFATTFANVEGARIRDEWIAAQKLKGSGLAKARAFMGQVANKAGDVYALTEAVFKIAKIRDAMEREGKSATDAVLEAQDALFDYSLVPRSVRYARNQPLGAPFITFFYKMLGRLAQTAVKHPLRFAPYAAVPYLLGELIQNAYDVDDDDIERLRKAFPAWMRERGHMLLLPYKDSRGRWQMVDMGYLVPWGQLADMYAAAREGKGGKELLNAFALGGPLPDVISAIETNIDPFTGDQIINAADPPALKLQALAQYVWNLAMPPFLTDRGAIAQYVRAARGKNVNSRGEPGASPWQAAGRLFGINVYPVDPEKSRAANLRGLRYEMEEVQARGRELMRDRNLSAAEREELRATFAARLRELSKRAQDYARESEINDKLK